MEVVFVVLTGVVLFTAALYYRSNADRTIRHLLEMDVDSCFMIDGKGKIVFMNSACKKQFNVNHPSPLLTTYRYLLNNSSFKELCEAISQYRRQPQAAQPKFTFCDNQAQKNYVVQLLPSPKLLMTDRFLVRLKRFSDDTEPDGDFMLHSCTQKIIHDIKTHLSTNSLAIMNLQYVLEEPNSGVIDKNMALEFAEAALQAINDSLTRLDELSILSRDFRLYFSPVNLAGLASTVLDNLGNSADIETDFEKNLPLTPMDERAMRLAIQKIITGVTNHQNNNRQLRLRIAAVNQDLHITGQRTAILFELKIQDSEIPRIFDLFAENSKNNFPARKQNVEIYVIKRILAGHSSQLICEKQSGSKAIFYFLIPTHNEDQLES